MNDGPEWFAPKRYGYGSGLPISWQGRALTAGFVGVTLAMTVPLRHQPVAIIAALIPLAVGFSLVARAPPAAVGAGGGAATISRPTGRAAG